MAALGRPAYITSGRAEDLGEDRSAGVLRARAVAVLDVAYEGGIRYVDTARSYGRAEEFLAFWLQHRQANDLTVASKWGYAYVGDWRMDAEVHEVKDHSRAAFGRQLGETTRHLGSRLDVYQVHSVTADGPVLTDTGLHRALAGLRDRGVKIGFTTSGPRQAEVITRACDISIDGALLFSSVQSTWNLLEQSAGNALAAAASQGVEVVIKECLANGRLAAAETPATDRFAREGVRGLGPDQLAIAAALSQPWATRVLVGAVTTEHVRRSLQAASSEVLELIDPASLVSTAEDPATYWAKRSQRGWN